MLLGYLALITGAAALAIGWRLRRTDFKRPNRLLGLLFIVAATVFLWSVITAVARANPADPRLYAPPPEYTKGPARATVLLLDITTVSRRCSATPNMPSNATALACTIPPNGLISLPIIIMPLIGQISDELWLWLIDHELSHARGWPADHPGAIPR